MLAYERLPASHTDATPKTIFFLHGILGRGRNLRTLARGLVARRPGWDAVVVDLRGHGQSLDVPGPDTLAEAARDVQQVAASLGQRVDAVFGHSFGGKVALELGRIEPTVSRVFVGDAVPGARPDRRGSEVIATTLEALARLPQTLPTRESFVDALRADGMVEGQARWLSMNLRAGDDGFSFGPDLERIHRLLADYFSQDLWPVLEPPRPGLSVDLIVGEKSAVYGPPDRARAAQLERDYPGQVRVHPLAEAGHWVHIDDPAGVAGVLEAGVTDRRGVRG